jgi:hypothetical protein
LRLRLKGDEVVEVKAVEVEGVEVEGVEGVEEGYTQC